MVRIIVKTFISCFNQHYSTTGILFSLLLLTLLPNVALPGGEAANTCPRKCQCIWRDSKITVDCSDQTLSAIPTTVEKNTQVLNVSGNDIPMFSRSHFSRLGLINLQRVSCSRCNLGSVDPKAFLGLTNLVELDLSANKLTDIPSEALNGEATALMSLSLRANPIETVGTKAFHRLKYLTKLDLSECHISNVDPGAFEGLESLQRIYLHNNRLTTISGRDIPPSLHGLSVQDNSWSCDCQLRSFRLWLTQSNVPRPVEPVCRSPRRLVGIRIQSLSLAEFACPPQLSPTSMFLTVPKGKNVSIVCRVSSDPVSQITWFFNGKPLVDDEPTDFQQGIYPRTSERLLEGNVEASPSTVVSVDSGGHPRVRVIRQDDLSEGGGSGGETRSELLIHHTSADDNGTYYCQAENKAARSISNFTLHVTDRDFNPDAPTILQLRLEYFIAAAIAIIIILILILVIVAVLFVRVCRNRTEALDSSSYSDGIVKPVSNKLGSVASLGSVAGQGNNGHGCKIAPTLSAKMPKHIQMGTGFVATTKISPDSSKTILPSGPVILSTALTSQPDLLTDHNSSLTLSNGKKSNQTGTTSLASSSEASNGSYRVAMENIIHDYKQVPSNTPLIGGGQPMSHCDPQTINDGSLNMQQTMLVGGTLPRASWSYKQNPRLTTFQSPMTSLAYSNLSEVPLLEHQQLLSSQVSEYPHDFGLPRTAPSRSSNLNDYLHFSAQLGRTPQHSWLTLPSSQQYRLDPPIYFPTPKHQMLPDEKYPEPTQQQMAQPPTTISVMNLPFSAPMPQQSDSSIQRYLNTIKNLQSGSKSLIISPTSQESRDEKEDPVYHSISGACPPFEDEISKNGGAPIYESIEHPGNAFQNYSSEYQDSKEDESKGYELLESKGGQLRPPEPALSESSKMELYSKVNKRKTSSEKENSIPPPQSTTSSSSSGSPPPLESVAPSRRIRRRSSRQKSPSSIQARSTMALERLTKLLLSAPESPPDDNDSMDDLLTEIQNQKAKGENRKSVSNAPMATSESSCGNTRAATTEEEDNTESKNINQELDDAFTSLDQEMKS